MNLSDEIARPNELLVRIDRGDLNSSILNDEQWRDASLGQDARESPHVNRKGHEDGRTNRVAQTFVARIRHDADDSQPAIGIGRRWSSRRLVRQVGCANFVTDRVAIWPILARPRLIDDGDGLGAHGFGVVPDADLQERNAKDRKILGSDEVHRNLGRAEVGPAEKIDAHVIAVVWRSAAAGDGGGFDFRQSGDSRAKLFGVLRTSLPGAQGFTVKGNYNR